MHSEQLAYSAAVFRSVGVAFSKTRADKAEWMPTASRERPLPQREESVDIRRADEADLTNHIRILRVCDLWLDLARGCVYSISGTSPARIMMAVVKEGQNRLTFLPLFA